MITERVRKDGSIAYQVRMWSVDQVTGKRKNTIIGTYDKQKDAERAEARAQIDASRGLHVDPSKITVSKQLNDWLRSKKKSLSANSHADYRAAIDNHIKPALGSHRLQKLKPVMIQEQYDRWHDAGMSAPLIHRLHVILSQALEQAVLFGFLNRNPADHVDKPKLSKSKPDVWNEEELRTFLDVAAGDALAPLWFLLALEGMRRGEALGLRWRDIDWKNGAANIVQTVILDKANGGTAAIQQRTKTQSGSRPVKLTAATLEALTEHRDRQAFARKAAGELWHVNDLIVCTSLGTPINPRNVTRSFERLVKAAGVPLIRVHDMRHGAATMLLRAGMNPKIVSERLGHSKVSITLDIYSHVIEGMQDQAAAAMDAIVSRDRKHA